MTVEGELVAEGLSRRHEAETDRDRKSQRGNDRDKES